MGRGWPSSSVVVVGRKTKKARGAATAAAAATGIQRATAEENDELVRKISPRRLRPSKTRSRRRSSTRGGPGKLKETKEERSAKKKDPGKDGAGADESELFKDWDYPELAANEDEESCKELGEGVFSNLVRSVGH